MKVTATARIGNLTIKVTSPISATTSTLELTSIIENMLYSYVEQHAKEIVRQADITIELDKE